MEREKTNLFFSFTFAVSLRDGVKMYIFMHSFWIFRFRQVILCEACHFSLRLCYDYDKMFWFTQKIHSQLTVVPNNLSIYPWFSLLEIEM